MKTTPFRMVSIIRGVMDGVKPIPRMRTAAKAAAELKAMDPDTEVTEYFIRQLIKTRTIPVVKAGNKALVNLNDLLDLLCVGSDRQEPKTDALGGIRRIDEKRPMRGA